MPANTLPIFPAAPVVGIASLVSATPVTSYANITGTTGLVQLTATSAEGTRVDNIVVKAQGTTVSSTVSIWLNDGTTSRIFDEIDVPALVASTTVDSFVVSRGYTNLTLPPTFRLFVSQTVATNVNVFAFGGTY
jgi:hypothetical protein